MDQQSNTTPSVRLPQPSLDPMAVPQAVPQFSPVAPMPQLPPQQVAAATPSPMPTPPVQSSAPVPTETTTGDAQDEEWIAKAQSVAMQYKNDPHAQSNALSKLRAEYLYKQHGITTKLGESK